LKNPGIIKFFLSGEEVVSLTATYNVEATNEILDECVLETSRPLFSFESDYIEIWVYGKMTYWFRFAKPKVIPKEFSLKFGYCKSKNVIDFIMRD
jgi:hypothetical protein